MVIGIMVEVGPLFGVPSSIKEVGALVVLILVLLIRPQGILGPTRADRLMTHARPRPEACASRERSTTR